MINLKQKKVRIENTFDGVNALHEGRQLTLKAFKSECFQLKKNKEKY